MGSSLSRPEKDKYKGVVMVVPCSWLHWATFFVDRENQFLPHGSCRVQMRFCRAFCQTIYRALHSKEK